MIILEVLGTPAPKGSSRAVMSRGKALLLASGSRVNAANLKSWDQSVRLAANRAVAGRSHPPFVGVPVKIGIIFRITRPAGHWGKKGLKPSAPAYPATKPDIDKLARATVDSLIGSVMDDDSRIVVMLLEKVYAEPGREGATITISHLD